MFKNVFYDKRKSVIHLWENINGENFYDEINFVPYCFVNSSSGSIKTMYGENVQKVEFNSYKEYKNFTENNNCFENGVIPEIQFINEKYKNINLNEKVLPKLKIYSLDIEVYSDNGFPYPKDSYGIITLISILDFTDKHCYTFGMGDFQNNDTKNVTYLKYDSEEKMLKGFYSWWNKNVPDIVTGWNISSDFKMNPRGGFDLPYLINRTKRLFGEKTNLFKKLSPINTVFIFERNKDDDDVVYSIEIAGVSIIDYLSLYKWYTTNNLASHTLENVSQIELNEGKLEYENNLNWLYKNDFQKYTEYNIQDVLLIEKLENKLNYLKLAYQLCLLCKTPLKCYNGSVNLIEGLMLSRFRANNMCAPRLGGGKIYEFEGGYVKEPQNHFCDWLFSLDITSSYPFAMIVLNMSNETLYGKIQNLDENEIKRSILKKEFPKLNINKNGEIITLDKNNLKYFNTLFQKKMLSISPNGVVFNNIKNGEYATMIRSVFLERKNINKKLKKLKVEYLNNKNEKLSENINMLNTLQQALKIIINSAYGILSAVYSRYFNMQMVESIPSVGRESLKYGIQFSNEILNDPNEELKNILKTI